MQIKTTKTYERWVEALDSKDQDRLRKKTQELFGRISPEQAHTAGIFGKNVQAVRHELTGADRLYLLHMPHMGNGRVVFAHHGDSIVLVGHILDGRDVITAMSDIVNTFRAYKETHPAAVKECNGHASHESGGHSKGATLAEKFAQRRDGNGRHH